VAIEDDQVKAMVASEFVEHGLVDLTIASIDGDNLGSENLDAVTESSEFVRHGGPPTGVRR